MNINLNGQTKSITEDQNLKDLIDSLCKNPNHVIAEVNGQIVKSDSWEATVLKQDDSLELVTFVGGG